VATERARDHLRSLGYDVPTPRRGERVDPGLWDGMTTEGRSEGEELAENEGRSESELPA
jgi:hypothetical protein